MTFLWKSGAIWTTFGDSSSMSKMASAKSSFEYRREDLVPGRVVGAISFSQGWRVGLV